MSDEHQRLRQEGWNVRINRTHPFLFRPQIFMSFQSLSSEKPKHSSFFVWLTSLTTTRQPKRGRHKWRPRCGQEISKLSAKTAWTSSLERPRKTDDPKSQMITTDDQDGQVPASIERNHSEMNTTSLFQKTRLSWVRVLPTGQQTRIMGYIIWRCWACDFQSKM